MTQPTPDEIMVVCMARQIQDGEIVAQGIATPLVATAYLLARYTHAPTCILPRRSVRASVATLRR